MGACQSSNQYYFGFINLSISHIDVLSFVMGVVLTIGVMALVRRCKEHRRAARHILGKSKQRYNGKARSGPDMDWGPQASPPFYMMTSMMPPAPTAPYPGAHKTASIPWPSNTMALQ